MTESTQDNPGISHDALTRLTEKIGVTLRDLLAGYDEHGSNPWRWPHMAAVLQSTGPQLTALGQLLSAYLAVYAQDHPTVEVPEEGPSVMLLPPSKHTEFWNMAGELPDTYEEAIQPYEPIQAYAEILDGEYGRPELDVRAIALDDQGAVMVLQYLIERGPDAVCQVYIGGWDHTDTARVAQALDEHGISFGQPRYWPPVAPDATFLNLPGDENVYDAFGRLVQPEQPIVT